MSDKITKGLGKAVLGSVLIMYGTIIFIGSTALLGASYAIYKTI